MSARVIIRRVRFKSGGEIHLLAPTSNENRARVERGVRAALDAYSEDGFAGFAFVVWGADGSTAADLWAGPDSTVPAILIPDLVRSQLLAMKIEQRTIDTINEDSGYTPNGSE